MSKTLGTQH